MIPYARLTPGPGFDPVRALLYYAQRLVTLPWPRRLVAGAIAAAVQQLHRLAPELAIDETTARALADLARDGLALMPPLLPDAAVGKMSEYFRGKPVIAPTGELVPLDRLPAGVATADYPLATVLDCPGMLELLNSPAMLRLGAGYLGCKPTLSSVGVRWSFPRPRQAARVQQFHRDVDDWRFFKLFIYLTDVDAESGPHTYVRGSQRSAFGVKSRTYGRDELERRFGAGSLLSVVGPRGTTFVADTLGAHRGDTPVDRPRLIFQAQYSLLPIFAFDYAPVRRPGRGVDAYSNRLLLTPTAAAERSGPEGIALVGLQGDDAHDRRRPSARASGDRHREPGRTGGARR